jgi:hypothetical protein
MRKLRPETFTKPKSTPAAVPTPVANNAPYRWGSALRSVTFRLVTFVVILASPFLIVTLGLKVKAAYGPYWGPGIVDPSYGYLFGSIAFNEGRNSTCCFHPGTLVQVNGSLVISLVHKIIGTDPLPIDFFRKIEVYGALIGFETLMLYALALVSAGWAAYSISGWLAMAPLVQLPALLSVEIFEAAARISPELWVLALATAFVTVLLLYVGQRGNDWVLAILLGIIVGMGISAKITFFPLLLAPLIVLSRWRLRTAYALAAVAGFLVIALPHWTTITATIEFVRALATHKGPNGNGAPGSFDLHQQWNYLKYTVTNDVPLVAAVLLAIVTIIFYRGSTGITSQRMVRCLLGFTAAAAVQVFMASKQPSPHYMLGSDAMIGMVVVFSLWLTRLRFPNSSNILAGLFIALMLGACFYWIGTIDRGSASRSAILENGAGTLQLLARKYPGYVMVAAPGAECEECALFLGNGFVNGAYSDQLRTAYPKAIFYHPESRRFIRFGPVEITPAELLAMGPVIIRGNPITDLKAFNLPNSLEVSKVGELWGETLYRLTRKSDSDTPPR